MHYDVKPDTRSGYVIAAVAHLTYSFAVAIGELCRRS
jgi:hypothetical protein